MNLENFGHYDDVIIMESQSSNSLVIGLLVVIISVTIGLLYRKGKKQRHDALKRVRQHGMAASKKRRRSSSKRRKSIGRDDGHVGAKGQGQSQKVISPDHEENAPDLAVGEPRGEAVTQEFHRKYSKKLAKHGKKYGVHSVRGSRRHHEKEKSVTVNNRKDYEYVLGDLDQSGVEQPVLPIEPVVRIVERKSVKRRKQKRGIEILDAV